MDGHWLWHRYFAVDYLPDYQCPARPLQRLEHLDPGAAPHYLCSGRHLFRDFSAYLHLGRRAVNCPGLPVCGAAYRGDCGRHQPAGDEDKPSCGGDGRVRGGAVLGIAAAGCAVGVGGYWRQLGADAPETPHVGANPVRVGGSRWQCICRFWIVFVMARKDSA